MKKTIESYVRNAPKRHELYQGNLEVRGYACREYGGECGEWLVREILRQGGSIAITEGSDRERPTDEQKKPVPWKTVALAGD